MCNGNIRKITSLDNPYVKHLVRLRENRAYREEKKRTLLVGEELIDELGAKIRCDALITRDSSLLSALDPKVSHYLVPAAILKKISGLATPPPLCAEVIIPNQSDLSPMSRLIACEAISDPGNLGTLVRTALALGWEGIILLEHATDLFHEKAIRASRGSCLFFPYLRASLSDFKSWCRDNHFHCYLADLKGTALSSLRSEGKKLPRKRMIVLGSEAQGLSIQARSLGDAISIPTQALMPSLNVAIAGAIFMHELSAP